MVKPTPRNNGEIMSRNSAVKESVDLNSLPLLISVPMAAKILGLSRASAYRLATSGDLPSRRLGNRIFIITAAIKEIGRAA
jgi:predicted DNA-binding transcriptional regulator AlpA